MISLAIKNELSNRGIIKKKRKNYLTKLAEAIILQSVEDLFDDRHIKDCESFFFGEGFTTCAEIAGIKTIEQIKLINIVKKYLDNKSNNIGNFRKGNFFGHPFGRGR
ncbi:MAG: hypothetical protein IBX72_02645 [Nitrospirae bacterium]|jgi:hypothetical protein|nr:hypothetical protein [Nitrospirota bacterium]